MPRFKPEYGNCSAGSDCTAACLAQLRAAKAKPYATDRSRRIPGLDSEQDEFIRPKTWYKRVVFETLAALPQFDWLNHRHILHRWVRESEAEHRHWTDELLAGLTQYGLDKKLRRFHHHETHAANAFFSSGYDQALVVPLDGYGSGCAGGVYVGDAQGVRVLHRFPFPNSLALQRVFR